MLTEIHLLEYWYLTDSDIIIYFLLLKALTYISHLSFSLLVWNVVNSLSRCLHYITKFWAPWLDSIILFIFMDSPAGLVLCIPVRIFANWFICNPDISLYDRTTNFFKIRFFLTARKVIYSEIDSRSWVPENSYWGVYFPSWKHW